MDRKQQYKPGPSATVDDLRTRRRNEDSEMRKSRRDRLVKSKRMRLESSGNGNDDDITVEQVAAAAKMLVNKEGDRRELMKIFRKAFAQGTLLTETFLGIDNAMATMVGLLTGSDPDLQLDAAWCLTNMAAGTHDHGVAVLRAAGPYLITYLSSGNTPLQDQCSWALGNIAGDGMECRDALISQGVLQPLVDLLRSPMPNVVSSACFALSNLARGPGADTGWLLTTGALPQLIGHLTYKADNLTVIAEVGWVLTYVAASGEIEPELVDAGTIEQVSALLVALAQHHGDDFKVFTPMLRCLGNLCSANDANSERACGNANLIPALGKCLTSDHRHIKKETLWVLSNITGSPVVSERVIQNGLLKPIVGLLDGTFDIKKEAAYAICNITSHGKVFCEETLSQGALPGMIPLLKSSDMEVAHMGLSYTEMVLRMVPDGKRAFEENGGLDALEILEYHNNDTLRSEANDILDKYFYQDDMAADLAGDMR